MSVYLDMGKPVTASYLLPSKQVSHPQGDPAECADLGDEVTPTSSLQYSILFLIGSEHPRALEAIWA